LIKYGHAPISLHVDHVLAVNICRVSMKILLSLATRVRQPYLSPTQN
jgi:hypothetical protein